MNDITFDRISTARPQGLLQAAVADAAGMVWGHANPAELYRWISRRNDLLHTIASAVTPASARGVAGRTPASKDRRRADQGRRLRATPRPTALPHWSDDQLS